MILHHLENQCFLYYNHGKTSLQEKHYIYFNYIFKLNIKRNTVSPIIELPTDKLKKIDSDKPICVVNPNFNFCGFDSRFWGINNYQTVIDKFKDKINFISIGSNNYNYLINSKTLNNLYMNFVNKISILETLNVIAQSKFVLTHESGLYHAGCINNNTDFTRHVIVPAGARMLFKTNKWETENVNIHWLEPENKEIYLKHCLNNVTRLLYL